MNPERLAALALAVAALLAPAPAGAHGVHVEVQREGGAVAVRARYEGGRPLAGARYEVVSPAHPERAFAEGTTDRHGWVAFSPDAAGAWSVRIVDAAGHGKVATVEIRAAEMAAGEAGAATSTPTATPTATATATSAETSIPIAAPTAARLPYALRSLLGAAALALAFGAIWAVQRRRRERR